MPNKTLYFVQPYVVKHHKLVASGALTFRTFDEAIATGAQMANRRAGVVVMAQSYDAERQVMSRPTVLRIHGRVPDGWLVDRAAA